jgi:hypothetical protein
MREDLFDFLNAHNNYKLKTSMELVNYKESNDERKKLLNHALFIIKYQEYYAKDYLIHDAFS